MTNKTLSYYDIISMDKTGIKFKNGGQIIFSDCKVCGNGYSENCIAERNAAADPPYVEFFTPGTRIRIVLTRPDCLKRRTIKDVSGSFISTCKSTGVRLMI